MTTDPAGSGEVPASGSILDQLVTAPPRERAELVLRRIEEQPDGRLTWPERGPVPPTLDGIDLGPSALRRRAEALSGPAPPWWDPDHRIANLRGADLRGARLRRCCLRGADLRGADLEGAALGGADLRRANLESANLQDADLAGARLARADLGQADLRGAMFEDADLREANLRFADLRGAVLEQADLRRADLWSARLEGAALNGSRLQRATFHEADLRRADLSGADLSGAAMGKADLRGARLVGADLRGIPPAEIQLEEADLSDARLEDLDLSRCNLARIRLGGAYLDRTRMRQEQFGGALGEELAGELEAAARGYQVLERNFADLGDPDATSWAYRKRRRMQKKAAARQARAALRAGQWRQAAALYARSASDQAAEWLCDYGESVPRVLGTMLVIFLLFTLIYGLTGSVMRVVETPSGRSKLPTSNPSDLVLFSLLTMTTLDSPAVGLEPRTAGVQLLMGLQGTLGIGLAGLLGFVLGNRIRR